MASRVLKNGKTRITQGFSDKHKGVDLGRTHLAQPIIAHSGGTVTQIQTGHKNNKGATGNASYGNFVKIEHDDGYSTLYAHLASVAVKKGDKVKPGQEIGMMGNSGNSYGMHLHFEVRRHNSRIDPTPYLESDFPAVVSVAYQVYTNRWLPAVTDCHDAGSDGYAGIHKQAVSGLLAKPEKGVLRYRVHLLGEKRWLPWVENDTDYAGNLGQAIDAVQMELLEAEGYRVQYRVSPTNSKRWYGWCVNRQDATGDGYAGVFGKAIDCIQMKIVRG